MTNTPTTALPNLEAQLMESVFTALGAASTCWETLNSAGVFDSTRAKQIGDQLVAEIVDITAFGQPSLGCATTRELVTELAARMADPISSHPDYRTVGTR